MPDRAGTELPGGGCERRLTGRRTVPARGSSVTNHGHRASDGRHAVSLANALSLERSVVASCLDANARAGDATFEVAFVQSLAALRPAARRGALGGVTGHGADSVTEIVLEAVGWTPVWHFAGPGRHGVDLLVLGPGEERLFAVEVKGTPATASTGRACEGAN